MPQLIQAKNRFLPENWRDSREMKKGFKIHKGCSGAIRACIGLAIKWQTNMGKVIYINTNSVKHWWKSNIAWREENGFGGDFSKKKLRDLLSKRIQAQTTSGAIRRASQSISSKEEVNERVQINEKKPEEVQKTEQVPLTDQERLKKFCDDCEKILANHRSIQHQNLVSFEEGLRDIDLMLNEWKEWETLSDPAQFKTFNIPQEKNLFENSIRQLRIAELEDIGQAAREHLDKAFEEAYIRDKDKIVESIVKTINSKNLEEMEEFLSDNSLTLPTFKEFDSETEKVMQKRWILVQIIKMDVSKYAKIIATKNEEKKETVDSAVLLPLTEGNISEAIQQAQKICDQEKTGKTFDKYNEIKENLKKLEKFLEEHQKVKNLDLIQIKTNIKQTADKFLVISHQYEKYKTKDFSKKLSERISFIAKVSRDLSTREKDFEFEGYLSKILKSLEKHLPQNLLLPFENRDYFEDKDFDWPSIQKNTLDELAEERKKEFDEVIKAVEKEINDLELYVDDIHLNEQKDILPKLKECKECTDVLQSDQPIKNIWDILHQHYPQHFAQFQEMDAALDPRITQLKQKEDWSRQLSQVVSEIKSLITEDLAKEARPFVKKLETLKNFIFNPETFAANYSEQQKKFKKFKEEIEAFLKEKNHGYNGIDLFPEEFEKKLEIPEELDEYYEQHSKLFNQLIIEDRRLILQPDNEEATKEKLKKSVQSWLSELDKEQETTQKKDSFIALRKTLNDIQSYIKDEIDQTELIQSLKSPLFQNQFLNQREDVPDDGDDGVLQYIKSPELEREDSERVYIYPIDLEFTSFTPESPQGRFCQKQNDFRTIVALSRSAEKPAFRRQVTDNILGL